jgi:hypothetical protein
VLTQIITDGVAACYLFSFQRKTFYLNESFYFSSSASASNAAIEKQKKNEKSACYTRKTRKGN